MASQILGERRRTNATISKGDQGRLNVTMSVTFLIVSDDKFASREEILLLTSNAPVVGLLYGPLGLVCVSKTVERLEENALYWEMTCEFDSARDEHENDPENPTDPNNPGQPNPDPETWLSIISWNLSLESFQKVWQDYNGDFYKNTAGELIDPLPVWQRTLCSTEFTNYHSSSLDIEDIAIRNNTINNADFKGFKQHCLLLHVLNAERGTYNGYKTWKVTYKLTHAPQFSHGGTDVGGWIEPFYSFGWNYWDGTQLQSYRVNGENIFGPLLANGDKTANPLDPGTAHPFTRQPYEAIDFSFLRIRV
jgi:hypothetical protein